MIDTSRINVNGKVFCVAPWMNLDIRQDGEVKPCCVSEYLYGDIKQKSLWEIWNDDPIKKLRENMLNGVPHKNCEVCYVNEKAGKSSLRQDLNGSLFRDYPEFVYKTNDDYSVTEPGFVQWDVKLSSKCNFKSKNV